MNSSGDKAAMDAMYVILGSSGHTGSIIADFLLSKGQKVRVVGRDARRGAPAALRAQRRRSVHSRPERCGGAH